MAKRNPKFEAILAEALAAGAAAGANLTGIAPMVVMSHANPLDDASPVEKAWYVADGVCGFGWVHMPGNTAFGRWAKANGHARPDYPNGLSIWSKLSTQSMARNEAWAMAVAKSLNAADPSIKASGRSRID